MLFVVLGGLLLWRWPRLAWLHAPAFLWGAALELGGWICPLTPLENRLRMLGGEAGYEGGFIEHYLVALLYPEALTRELRHALGAFVLAVNGVVYGLLVARWRRGTRRGHEVRG